MAVIHPTAIVDPKAELADSVEIGAYSVIGPEVSIGARSSVGPHCVIEGRTRIGEDNRIWQFVSLGAAPQDKKYAGEPTSLTIGNRNTIREFCTFSRGTVQDGGVTAIGDDNWVMAYVHIAHDCQLGNHITLANCATLAGHVHLGDWVTLAGFTGVHQFVKVGAHVMTGIATALTQDVPPYMMVSGNPAETHGYNAEGLRRRGFTPERLAVVKQMHRLLYRQGLTFDAACAAINDLAAQHADGATDSAMGSAADIALMSAFLGRVTRGIVR